MDILNESNKNIIWRMFAQNKIIILILSIQLILVHGDGQSNNDVTKLINYAKVLLSGLTDHITYVDGKFVHLNQLPESEMDELIKNHELRHVEFKQYENKLHLLQNNLTELASLPLDKEEDIEASKAKSITLQKEFDHLNKEFNKLRICRNLPILYDLKTIDEILEKYNNLVSEKIKIDKKIEDKEQKHLLDDCVLSIERGRYTTAAEKFNLVKDDNKINDFVNRIYLEHGAFYVLRLGYNINDLKRTYLLYKALFNKLHNDEERSKYLSWHFDQYIALMKSLKRELLEHPLIDAELKAKAAELIKAIRGDNVKFGIKLLTDVVVSNPNKEEGVDFLRRPLTFDYESVGEICYHTIVDNHKQYLNSLKETLNALFNELSTLEGNVLHFGQLIKYLETKLKGTEYESSLQLDFVGLKEKLPKIVRNILYSEKVCIKLDGSNMYLFEMVGVRADFTSAYEVYTGLQRFELAERWQLIHVHGDEFIIINVAHNYSLHTVFTRVRAPKEKINDHNVITTNKNQQSNIWKIEVNGDYAYIKNTANNEYLYASHEFNIDAAATSNFFGEFSKTYQWNILDCTNVPLGLN
uniref:Salivary secreted protein n=1 Tax=Triatoma infestans TaxID=30076 RepID=A0A161MZT3_TRIIF